MAKSKEELKSFLTRVKEECEKVSLKLNVKKTKIMASWSWHTSWQIEGEKVEAVTDFLFLSSKITPDGDCSHEIRRLLLLGSKAMTNKSYESVLKSKDISLPTKVCIVKAYGFSSSHVQKWELDSKESRASKNWCFQTVVLENSWESLGQQDQTTQS